MENEGSSVVVPKEQFLTLLKGYIHQKIIEYCVRNPGNCSFILPDLGIDSRLAQCIWKKGKPSREVGKLLKKVAIPMGFIATRESRYGRHGAITRYSYEPKTEING